MPAVKLLHQESDSNTKPEFIMGHAFQAVAVLVSPAKSVFAVPLASRIHEGVVLSNRDQRTLLDKMVLLLDSLGIEQPFDCVADAYYASGTVIRGLLSQGHPLVTRARINAVAYHVASAEPVPQRGRPRTYGKKGALSTWSQRGIATTSRESSLPTTAACTRASLPREPCSTSPARAPHWCGTASDPGSAR